MRQSLAGPSGAALALILLLILASTGPGCSSSPTVTGARVEPSQNPFGVMPAIAGAQAPQGMALAAELGVRLYRPHDISLESWNVMDPGLEAPRAGDLGLVLTVRNMGTSWPSLSPSSAPADLQSYRQKLGEVLDSFSPEILFVENEEDLPASWSGTPEQYGMLLAAACETAHARGIECANGGLSCETVALLTWDHYRQAGLETEAEDFFRRTASPGQLEMMDTEDGRSLASYRIKQGKRLLGQYRRAGADYVNFHWYASDPQSLGEAASFLCEATGLQPVCNEMGCDDAGPDGVTANLEESLRLGMPCVIWSSIDRGSARALQGPDWTLRENGVAFQAFMRETF